MSVNSKIKDMYQEERPYEKCVRFGAENLTDRELLAVILRTGTRGENSLELAGHLLHPEFAGSGLVSLHQWTYERLKSVKGIGKVKAIQILCLAELSKRMAMEQASKGMDFSTPHKIALYYMEDMRHRKQEVLKLLLLNTKARLIGENNISVGTVDQALVSPRDLFREALMANASSIILLHNHPSGDPTPSEDDMCITARVFEAGALLGIRLLDHIIIGDNCFTSMKEKGFFQI